MYSRPLMAFAAFVLIVATARTADPERVVGANWAQAKKFTKEFVDQHLHNAFVVPSFIGKSDTFWYAVRTPQGLKYWKVDPTKKSKQPLFDHAKFLAQLSEQSQRPLDANSFQLSNTKVSDDALKMTFGFDANLYEYDLTAQLLKKLGKAPAEPPMPTPEMLERMTDDERREFFQRMRDRQEQKKDDEKKDDKKDDMKEVKKEENKELEKKDEKKEEKKDTETKKGFQGKGTLGTDYKAYSPDKKKYVYAFKFNLYLAEEGKEAEAKQLTTDGQEDYGYGLGFSQRRSDGTVEKAQPPSERKTRPQVNWSKDSKRFTVSRTDQRGLKELFLVDSIATPRPAMERYRYSMPGEESISKSELYIGDAEAKTLSRVKPKWKDEAYNDVRFGKTSEEVEFIRRDRLRRHHDLCRVNAKTGEEKVLIAEGFEAAYLEIQSPRIVEETDEIIWWSERSGWGHFYLYDRDGKLKNAITSGDWRASRIVDVDVKNRLVYFIGNAREPGENVYYTHYYRVRFDGSDLTNLTPGDANHTATLSPSKQFVVDRYSRIDLPYAVTLRNDKGEVLMELEQTDLSRLKATGWKLPEAFSVKAADGMTDLFGNMWKPFDFNANKRYPIIVYVYPGPQQEGVTHTFSAWSTYQQLAQLGFIVIQVGHRGGTPERSKAYHSFGYFNLRDYGLVDKKAAIEALAARHPWIDIERVGIYGHSGGAFMSAAAMLQKPYNEFFKAAVASAGNHDNNIYNNYWSETYHGLKEVPVTEEKKDGVQGQGTGTGKGGFNRVRKGGPEADIETLPPPRSADEKPLQDQVDALQKKLNELKKQLDDAAKVGGRQTEIEALTKLMTSVQDQINNLKKGQKEEGKKEEKKDEKKEEKKDVKTRFEIKIPTNAELAANLRGHLMLVHGEIDNNVHPANTMRLVDALIKANKRFDMLLIPGARHGFGIAQGYFVDRMWDFFAEHLLEDRQTQADIKERTQKKK
jgi:dipeptidyl-peptidase 4